MSVNQIASIFSQFAGISLQQALKYTFLINIAIKQIQQQLIDTSYIQSHSDLLNHLCASITFYQYALISQKDNLQGSFKAGDLSISPKSSNLVSTASILKDEMLAMASDILIDNNFMFRTV